MRNAGTTTAWMILILFLAHGSALASNACRETAQAVLQSDRVQARGEYQLALAKRKNLADPAARKACRKQARAELKDALQLSKDSFLSRVAACNLLGPDRYDPVIDPSNFTTQIDNPFFPLAPGTTFIYEGQTSAGFEYNEFLVTHSTREILGVTCVEVKDTVFVDGELMEDTLDWFAQDLAGNVWYFGENTHELVDGLITTIDGTFIAGVDGAKPGIIMKANPAVGDFYRQEFDLNNAEDNAEVTGLNESVTVPVGSFSPCLRTLETTPLEPELREAKFYASGVGNILTLDLVTGERRELVAILSPP